jgi:hypothetical protein
MRELINSCRIIAVKAEKKISLGRRRRRCEDNIKMNLKYVYAGVKWINLAKNRSQLRVILNTASKMSANFFTDLLGISPIFYPNNLKGVE